ncbi:MAG: hypothetical protein Q7T20_04155 [Saprospiraceae bacterium]|nr:hypothetical protein [Saprospiraceae bacterium]
MPNKTFEVKTYEVSVGYKNATIFNNVTIQIQGMLVGKGAAGERLIVYGLHPSSPVPPNAFCNWAVKIGSIFVPFAVLGQYVDILRNEKPVNARIDSDHPEWMAFSTGSESVGEGE